MDAAAHHRRLVRTSGHLRDRRYRRLRRRHLNPRRRREVFRPCRHPNFGVRLARSQDTAALPCRWRPQPGRSDRRALLHTGSSTPCSSTSRTRPKLEHVPAPAVVLVDPPRSRPSDPYGGGGDRVRRRPTPSQDSRIAGAAQCLPAGAALLRANEGRLTAQTLVSRPGDLAGLQARRADVQAPGRTVDDSSNRLNVGLELPRRLPFDAASDSVPAQPGHALAEPRPLATDVADSRHRNSDPFT